MYGSTDWLGIFTNTDSIAYSFPLTSLCGGRRRMTQLASSKNPSGTNCVASSSHAGIPTGPLRGTDSMDRQTRRLCAMASGMRPCNVAGSQIPLASAATRSCWNTSVWYAEHLTPRSSLIYIRRMLFVGQPGQQMGVTWSSVCWPLVRTAEATLKS